MFSDEIKQKLTKQDYSDKTAIEGVSFYELPQYADDSGSFVELGRLDNGLLKGVADFEVKQVNYSVLLPGAIKAAHLHEKQDDIWFVPPADELLVGLKDIRKGSATEGVVMRFVLGACRPRMLRIPHGVAHGVANPWHKPAALIYFVNAQFSKDPADCDEYRLPPYFFGEDFWKVQAG